jgi:hypothetical protein
MGDYLNPKGMTKEQFLAKHGREVTLEHIKSVNFLDNCAVIWVDNGSFTAAVIIQSYLDLNYYLRPDDRPKRYYIVPCDNSSMAC